MKNCSLYKRERGFTDLAEVARSLPRRCEMEIAPSRRTKTRLLHDTASQEFIARGTNANKARYVCGCNSRVVNRAPAVPSLKTIIKASRDRVVTGYTTESSVVAFEKTSGKDCKMFFRVVTHCRICYSFSIKKP